MKLRLTVLGISFVLFVLVLWATRPAAAWVSRTQSWEAYGGNGVRVTVIDTTSVCLYVASATVAGGRSVAITTVQKTQLPIGAGCQ